MTNKMSVTAGYDPQTGWRLLIGKEDVTRFIPKRLLLSRMSTRKRYPEGYRGYSYRDWVRKNKWIKALADSKQDRMCIYSAIREADF